MRFSRWSRQVIIFRSLCMKIIYTLLVRKGGVDWGWDWAPSIARRNHILLNSLTCLRWLESLVGRCIAWFGIRKDCCIVGGMARMENSAMVRSTGNTITRSVTQNRLNQSWGTRSRRLPAGSATVAYWRTRGRYGRSVGPTTTRNMTKRWIWTSSDHRNSKQFINLIKWSTR